MDGETLGSVGLAPGSREAADGLVSVRRPPVGLPVDEAALVRGAQVFDAVNYVFFRRFDDGRSSQPAAFIIDNTAERFTEGRLAESHHDLWLHGVAPLVYVAWPTRIDVLSCARGPDFWDDGQRHYSPAVQLDVASKVAEALAQRRRFSARRLADGTFWEEPLNQPLADHERAAHESLIRAVVETDAALDGETNPVSRRLLLLTILVKYLEDRGVFPGAGWFGRFRKGTRSFLDVLQGENPHEVSGLLEALEKKFNGERLPAARRCAFDQGYAAHLRAIGRGEDARRSALPVGPLLVRPPPGGSHQPFVPTVRSGQYGGLHSPVPGRFVVGPRDAVRQVDRPRARARPGLRLRCFLGRSIPAAGQRVARNIAGARPTSKPSSRLCGIKSLASSWSRTQLT